MPLNSQNLDINSSSPFEKLIGVAPEVPFVVTEAVAPPPRRANLAHLAIPPCIQSGISVSGTDRRCIISVRLGHCSIANVHRLKIATKGAVVAVRGGSASPPPARWWSSGQGRAPDQSSRVFASCAIDSATCASTQKSWDTSITCRLVASAPRKVLQEPAGTRPTAEILFIFQKIISIWFDFSNSF